MSTWSLCLYRHQPSAAGEPGRINLGLGLTCVLCRRASDSSSGWLDDQYSSLSSRHQLSWSRHQRPADLSPQQRRSPHALAVDDVARQGDRHHGCGRQLALTSRQTLTTLPQPSSLSALVEYVLLFSKSKSLFSKTPNTTTIKLKT